MGAAWRPLSEPNEGGAARGNVTKNITPTTEHTNGMFSNVVCEANQVNVACTEYDGAGRVVLQGATCNMQDTYTNKNTHSHVCGKRRSK